MHKKWLQQTQPQNGTFGWNLVRTYLLFSVAPKSTESKIRIFDHVCASDRRWGKHKGSKKKCGMFCLLQIHDFWPRTFSMRFVTCRSWNCPCCVLFVTFRNHKFPCCVLFAACWSWSYSGHAGAGITDFAHHFENPKSMAESPNPKIYIPKSGGSGWLDSKVLGNSARAARQVFFDAA